MNYLQDPNTSPEEQAMRVAEIEAIKAGEFMSLPVEKVDHLAPVIGSIGLGPSVVDDDKQWLKWKMQYD